MDDTLRPIGRALLGLALLGAVATSATAAPCAAEDFATRVTGVSQCLVIRRHGPVEPAVMVVWIHGDVSSGGPASYHFPLAERTAEFFAAGNVMAVALVRPGYPDGSGAASSVSLLHGGRADHYTRENILEVGTAIERLRQRFKPGHVVVVGHSGGAATAAVLLGLMPQVADAAVLVACPCELVSWRSGRQPWSRSENPVQWAAKVAPSARVIALTGTRDDNTAPALASAYVELLRSRGIDATFVAVGEGTHNGVARAPETFDAIGTLLKR